jgi:hypothetical protein
VQGGGGDIQPKTVFSYARFAYELPPGHFFQTQILGLTGYAELYTDPTNLQAAVQEWVSPDVESSKVATHVALGEKVKTKAPEPAQTTITVLNGNGVPGSAGDAGYLLGQRGYRIVEPPTGATGNAPRFDYFHTEIHWNPRIKRSKTAARVLAKLFAPADVKAMHPEIRPLANGAMLTVVVGQTFHGSLASAPIDQTPQRARPNVTSGASASRNLLRELRPRVPFRLMVPTVIERSSWIDREMPSRLYWIDDDRKHKAVRLVYRMSSNDYWGVQMTSWKDAPALSDRSHTRRIGGRVFDLYYDGAKLHMVVVKTPQAQYWVINTLLDRMSNETMLAIAKGLRPIASVK